MSNVIPQAACLLIGDELLSGRTQDSNAYHLAKVLNARGLPLVEVRIVPDKEDMIVTALRELKARADLVFTSGGIGPTHDDITAECVAKALGVSIGEREDALKILAQRYEERGEELTAARRRMARIPDGAFLIPNSVSGAPGFHLDGVFVLAGVPAIFQAMLNALDEVLPSGPEETVYTVTGELGESLLADGLRDLESALKGLKIGSYPGKTGTSGPLAIVCRSPIAKTAEHAALAVQGLFAAQGVTATVEKGDGRSNADQA
ncbi:MAG: molybdopterin-binding protein [Pseudomonadota bacterium]